MAISRRAEELEGAMTDSTDEQVIAKYYGGMDFESAVLAAIRAQDGDPNRLTLDDLASLDQLHGGGRAATEALARFAALQAGERLLDVGCGLGGPARVLASRFGCIVTGLDISSDFCRAARRLSQRVGLSNQPLFHQGSAVAMPFPNSCFDVVWMQNVGMNIGDKERLYAEIHRVLRSGGRFVFSEILGGSVQPLHYPVPWAPDGSLSFVRPTQEIGALLRAIGFIERVWSELPTVATSDRPQTEIYPNVFAAKLGPTGQLAGQNFRRNVAEGRLVEVEALFAKP
jgi:SAM-dependent methyltransferase